MAEDFGAECAAAAKGLRRAPADLRRALSRRVKDEVAEPLASRIRVAASGPWQFVLSGGTKTRAAADPTIVVGGRSPRLSGGGGPRSVVFGTEWGGGKRLTAVPRTGRHRGYRRYSTNQFRNHRAPFVFPTVNANMPQVLDAFATITLDVLDEAVN